MPPYTLHAINCNSVDVDYEGFESLIMLNAMPKGVVYISVNPSFILKTIP